MAKKNSLKKRRKHHEFMIKLEQEAEQLAAARQEKRVEKENQIKNLSKKPKVEPVKAHKKMPLAK